MIIYFMYGTCSLNIFQTMTYRRKPASSLTLAYYFTQRLFSLIGWVMLYTAGLLHIFGKDTAQISLS